MPDPKQPCLGSLSSLETTREFLPALPPSPCPYPGSAQSFPLQADRCPCTSGHPLIILIVSQVTADPARPEGFCAFSKSPGPCPCLGQATALARQEISVYSPYWLQHHPFTPAAVAQPCRVLSTPLYSRWDLREVKSLILM